MPTCLAISPGLTPASRSSRTLSAFALAVGARPLYLPSTLAFAPTSIRSRVNSRSNSQRSDADKSRRHRLSDKDGNADH
jgi:hypothetical protein